MGPSPEAPRLEASRSRWRQEADDASPKLSGSIRFIRSYLRAAKPYSARLALSCAQPVADRRLLHHSIFSKTTSPATIVRRILPSSNRSGSVEPTTNGSISMTVMSAHRPLSSTPVSSSTKAA